MKTETKDGWGTCDLCGNQAYFQTVDTQFGGKVRFVTCGHCDRFVCRDTKKKGNKPAIVGCGEIDWTGKLEVCKCGRDIKLTLPK